jgi:hypothetical protein|tara:strand:- start:125 stop:415 length:291 start_codon:yes stop_codon:yes gene_type:complete
MSWNRVKIHFNFSVIIDGDFDQWKGKSTTSISDAVENWVMESGQPLKLVCEEEYELMDVNYCGGLNQFAVYSEDIDSVEDLTHELAEEFWKLWEAS